MASMGGILELQYAGTMLYGRFITRLMIFWIIDTLWDILATLLRVQRRSIGHLQRRRRLALFSLKGPHHQRLVYVLSHSGCFDGF
jgi:hypothetical protein